jgi:hypothetical protein
VINIRAIAISCCVLWPAIAAAQAPGPATPPAAQDAKPAGRKADWKQMGRLLEPAIKDKDPIRRISGHMGKSADLLAKLDTGDPTQTVQRGIIVDLDAIIEELEKRKKKLKSGSSPDPDNPLPDSILAKGPGGQRDLRDPNASSRLWGQLSPKDRQQILQSQNEGFPPGYEAILSSYYKHLAQENVGDSDPSASRPQSIHAPSTRPAK